ncbi:MarR family winged helix-turn-helix transcriptional regulator [Streptomyces sp. ISL-11]|uniref:MarR family winged helix-turn-helix transcriptional regulator n=1 Tax=Streptomyces sp. ISL-11 TaxID=2819174 RepID=UPI001BE64DF3|nr:MarR family winged helix-turn-helix transcriptional regulator [Streptomyces sp. ISL-11]MBT2383713.1 winged helix-turn-helix transcriptional regulator [Streptomyces sp. ISL-11]
MAAQEQYEELGRQLGAVVAVRRDLGRLLPPECSPASAGLLALLRQNGEMRMGRLAELLAIDMSVTSRHVAYAADHGWLERHPDPADKRSRLLSISPRGEELLAEVSARYTQALAVCLKDWSDDDVSRLNELLARLRESFGDCRGSAHQPAAHHERAGCGAAPPARTPVGASVGASLRDTIPYQEIQE